MEFTMIELEAQLLPEREAPAFFNLASINASNIAASVNTLTINSAAVSSATQTIAVVQA